MNPIQSRLLSAFESHPTRHAIEGSEITLSYAELRSASNELAHWLFAHGARPGDVVPLFIGRSALLVLAQVALQRLGAAYAPIDTTSPPVRQRAMLDAIAPSIVIGAGNPAVRNSVLPDIEGSAPKALDIEAWWRTRGLHQPADTRDLWLDAPENRPAYVMFTSGSTGKPKGVLAPVSGIDRLVRSGDHIRFDADQRWAFVSSPAFDASTLEVWGPLLNGGCCVVQEEALPALDMLAEFFVQRRITDSFLTSALFNAMVEDHLPAFAQVRQLLAGGERVSTAHARRLLDAHPHVRLINGYGPTEDTTFSLCHTVTRRDVDSDDGVPIGRPLHGTRVRIRADGDASHEAPTEGELWVCGEGLALGYLGDAPLTDDRFVQFEGDRWYRTGDRVRRNADGDIVFIGRLDRQVKLRGHRIELEEVELALTRCSGVGEAVVLVAGDTAESRHMIAFVSPLAGVSLEGPLPDTRLPDIALLDAEVRQRLPASSVPGSYRILARLPRTQNGKLDRSAIHELIATTAVHGAPPNGQRDAWTFSARLRHMLEGNPSRLALETNGEALSYADLDRRSAALAAHLLQIGVMPGDSLALLLPRSTALVVAMVAAVRIGAVYAAIDLASPSTRIARMLDALHARFAIVDGPTPAGASRDMMRIDVRSVGHECAIEQEAPEWRHRSDDAPHYITFTSGSTGAPKGIVVPARGLARLLVNAEWASFPADARWLLVTSPAFDICNLEIWGALLNGACCVVQEQALPSLDHLARTIREQRISHAQMSTSLFNAMVDTQLASLGSLRQFISGGERASPPHMRKFLLAHPGVRLVNAYGPSETTVWSLARDVTLADTHEAAGVPIGAPIAGTVARVDAGSGEVGELLIGGDGLALGYLDDPGQTHEKFILRDGSRWYRSGDLARLRDDGAFEFHGRADRQIKLQGHRIEIDEVELAVASCAGVGEVAVILRGDDAAGRHLAACYSGLAGAMPAADAVGAHLASQLPAAAVPTELLALGRLPRNLNGKVDREALALLLDAAREAPPEASPQAASNLDGEFEDALAGIWRELLPARTLTRHSHFMRSGGTSLLALHVAALVRRRMQRDLSPVDVLRNPILSAQAEAIARLESLPGDSRPLAAMPGIPVPLTRNQQSILAASRLDPTGSAYLVHVALVLAANVDLVLMKEAFRHLAQRHPSLRLAAIHDGQEGHAWMQETLAEGWWQEHPPIDEAPLDLNWPDTLREAIDRPLDTSTRGSMRLDAWPIAQGGALVVWTAHHFVVDEASIDNALVELDSLMQGRNLAPVYGSPFAFKALEQAWSDRTAIVEWAKRFTQAWAGATAPLAPPPALGDERSFELSEATRQALAAYCRESGATPFPILLTAYGLALQDVFGPRFRFVLTPFSRRSTPESVEPISYLCDTNMVEAGARVSESRADTLQRVTAAVLRGHEPEFHLIEDLARTVSEVDAAAALGLWQFGFTWRLQPSRSLPVGGHAAQMIRVPQRGARHSVCLHAAILGDRIGYSIEAVAGAFESGQVEAIARRFESHLVDLCALGAMPRSVEKIDCVVEPSIASQHLQVLSGVWARRLGVSVSSILPASHFVREGGSSLAAMRMAAELRQLAGFKLDLGAFLANPTFAQLCAQHAEQRRPEVEGCMLFGPADFTSVLLLIPGAGGHAAGLFALAEALRTRMPVGGAVAIVDLDLMLSSAPAQEPLWFITRRIAQIAKDLGESRVAGMVGFSSGGLLALMAASEWGVANDWPIWMLDTFAPRAWRDDFWRKIERKVASFLRRSADKSFDSSPEDASVDFARPAMRASDAQWHLLGAKLLLSEAPASNHSVHLIRARSSAMRQSLLWRRQNNGFAPRRFASWSVHEVDGEHLDLPRHLASQTAQIILVG